VVHCFPRCSASAARDAVAELITHFPLDIEADGTRRWRCTDQATDASTA